jgi:hypothetical protein
MSEPKINILSSLVIYRVYQLSGLDQTTQFLSARYNAVATIETLHLASGCVPRLERCDGAERLTLLLSFLFRLVKIDVSNHSVRRPRLEFIPPKSYWPGHPLQAKWVLHWRVQSPQLYPRHGKSHQPSACRIQCLQRRCVVLVLANRAIDIFAPFFNLLSLTRRFAPGIRRQQHHHSLWRNRRSIEILLRVVYHPSPHQE